MLHYEQVYGNVFERREIKCCGVLIKHCQKVKGGQVITLLPWLITTSCLIFQIQISGSKSETLGRGFKLSDEDLHIRPSV